MTTPAMIELPLWTFKNIYMEQMWRLDDCLNQARRAWKYFEWYKNYVATKKFPETSFPLLMQYTCQNIQTNHQRNVELLWFLPVIPRQIPPSSLPPNFLNSSSTKRWTLQSRLRFPHPLSRPFYFEITCFSLITSNESDRTLLVISWSNNPSLTFLVIPPHFKTSLLP